MDPLGKDSTIVDFFEGLLDFKVFSHLDGQYYSYLVKITPAGWSVWCLGLGGECNPRGEPFLFDNLRRDAINYPAALGAYMQRLWRRATRRRMSTADVQNALAAIAAWVQQTERATPGDFLDDHDRP